MVQPKTPPLSIRLPSKALAELKAEAERRGVKVNALVVRAVLKELAMWTDDEDRAALDKASDAKEAGTLETISSAELRERLGLTTPAPKPWSGGHPKPNAGKR